MTYPLFHHDAYARSFQALVTAADGPAAVLDRTAFFPGGGGQPCDTGTLTVGGAVLRVTSVKAARRRNMA